LRGEGIGVAGGVFISYRREDSAGFAGRIYDRLIKQLDPKSVFLDVDNIQPGLDFFDVLDEKLRVCDVLIAIIGKNWNSRTPEDNQRRLEDPDDFVRIEIEAALRRGIRIIPLLVDGATMPRREDLPESLQKLRRRQAIDIAHNRFNPDVERLTHALALISEELHQRVTAEAERIARERRKRRLRQALTKTEQQRRVTRPNGRGKPKGLRAREPKSGGAWAEYARADRGSGSRSSRYERQRSLAQGIRPAGRGRPQTGKPGKAKPAERAVERPKRRTRKAEVEAAHQERARRRAREAKKLATERRQERPRPSKAKAAKWADAMPQRRTRKAEVEAAQQEQARRKAREAKKLTLGTT
jgi:hypothetical protein